jgi:hypothetical protein
LSKSCRPSSKPPLQNNASAITIVTVEINILFLPDVSRKGIISKNAKKSIDIITKTNPTLYFQLVCSILFFGYTVHQFLTFVKILIQLRKTLKLQSLSSVIFESICRDEKPSCQATPNYQPSFCLYPKCQTRKNPPSKNVRPNESQNCQSTENLSFAWQVGCPLQADLFEDQKVPIRLSRSNNE